MPGHHYQRTFWNDGRSGGFYSEVARKLVVYVSIALRWIIDWICGPSQVHPRCRSNGQSDRITGQNRWFYGKIHNRRSFTYPSRARSGLCAYIHCPTCLIRDTRRHSKSRCKYSRWVVCDSWLKFIYWESYIRKSKGSRREEGAGRFSEHHWGEETRTAWTMYERHPQWHPTSDWIRGQKRRRPQYDLDKGNSWCWEICLGS